VASLVRVARDRSLGAAATPLPPGLAGNRSRALLPDEELWRVTERWRGRFGVPALSYCTVRDWADSREAMGGLATASFDMKNPQRCWALKAIVGNVAPGGRLVEIGAGEPLVAGALSRMGYEVIVVDPYDGSGNGPREYRAFRGAYPELTFIRDRFPPGDPIEPPVDAVYSISVLEHVPVEAVEGVVRAAHQLVSSGGCCVHAIDHVLLGWGAEEHRARLDRIVAASGVAPEALEEAIAQLERDPDAYFVSAEAHNRWRGELPYDDYAMRRIASINLFTRG
jgi:2-polyprenyl-3-methyl-5-hydroxy-6-metoxy-1,4-benzoquinol methylase